MTLYAQGRLICLFHLCQVQNDTDLVQTLIINGILENHTNS